MLMYKAGKLRAKFEAQNPAKENLKRPEGNTRHTPNEGKQTYAVGHLALGYLTGKLTSRFLKVDANVPLLFVLSIISDTDLLIPNLTHRGPTHSIVVLLLLSFPAFMLYQKRAFPYFVALAQHSIAGDYLTGEGIQLLWPLSRTWYTSAGIGMASPTNILTEWALFLASAATMLTAKDAHALFQEHPSNLLLSVPVLTVLLPSLFHFPLHVPPELLIPHMVFLGLFGPSILVDLLRIFRDER